MTDVNLDGAQPGPRVAKQQKRRVPLSEPQQEMPAEGIDDLRRRLEEAEARAAAAERAAMAEPVDRGAPLGNPIDLSGEQVGVTIPTPANPYAPVGWRRKQRIEFDLTMPSGQRCRVMRLERDDLLRLNLIQELDTFTPLLMENSISDAERQGQMETMVKDDPQALVKMLHAVDKVVMAATINPRITTDEKLVNYGSEKDWANPDFVATVLLDDIDTFERMFIFGSAFGRSMDDLKSVFEQANGLDGMEDVAELQQTSQ